MYSFINEKQRVAFSSIFNEMDKNQDGRIDIDELKQNIFALASKDNLKHLLQVCRLYDDIPSTSLYRFLKLSLIFTVIVFY
jgi:Ca2+-binding EF-hand superfamily protein